MTRAHAFEVGGVLGRGGMGEVRIAWDPQLGRDVALKMVPPGDRDAAARLAREASLTARLEHPGILPIYEAGVGEDGRPWYAMRLFGGRTLGDAVAETRDVRGRLTLVRHVLAAGEALAYAHDREILHRDLSLTNVLAGPFGETVVADWGLACTFEEGRAGGAGGTTGFAAPELLRGDPVDARADVHGLGAVLTAVLTGGDPSPAALAKLSGVPPELVAIAERAHQAAPSDRYPDVHSFTADLLAWFEGRRVAAHDYTSAELLRRLVWAWRVPLVVGAVGVTGVVAAVAMGWASTAEERGRAEASEADAAQAREDERGAFATALRVQSFLAAEEGRTMDAEVLAAAALRRDDTPEGRGALAAVTGRPRWPLVARAELPSCRLTTLGADGSSLLCIGEEEARVYTVGEATPRANTEGDWIRGVLAEDIAVLIGAEGGIDLWDLRGPPRRVAEGAPQWGSPPDVRVGDSLALLTGTGELRIDLRNGTATRTVVCGGPGQARALALTSGAASVIACNDGRVIRVDPGGATTVLARVVGDAGTPTTVHIDAAGRVFVGTASGTAIVFGPDGVQISRRRLGEDMVVEASTRGDLYAVRLGEQDALLWDVGRDTLLQRFRGARGVAWTAAGDLRILGTTVDDRRGGEAGLPVRVPMGAGVAAVGWSPDGTALVAARGDGRAALLHGHDGSVVAEPEIGNAVVKDVAWSPAGDRWLAVNAEDGHRILDRHGVEVGRLAAAGARRGAWLADGAFWLAPYAMHLLRLSGEEARKVPEVPGLEDLETDVRGLRASGSSRSGILWAHEDGTWRQLAQLRPTTALAVTRSSTWVTTDRDLVRLDPTGARTWSTPIGPTTTDLAASDDDRWVAVGHLDGTIAVYRAGVTEPAGVLQGHRARVSALAFSPDGAWLASGSWDEEVRFWSTSAFEALLDAEAAWGTSLDEALDRPAATPALR